MQLRSNMNTSMLHHLKLYANRPILYVGEVGKLQKFERTFHPTFHQVQLYKYGISENVYRRIAYAHLKRFDYFDVRLLRETSANRVVERLLTHELKRKGLHVKMNINGHNHQELFYTEQEQDIQWIEGLIDTLISEVTGSQSVSTVHKLGNSRVLKADVELNASISKPCLL